MPAIGGKYLGVHSELICANSAYFSRDANQGRTHYGFPGVEETVLNCYINWLYTGTICSKEGLLGLPGVEDPEYVALAKLYILSKQIEDSNFAGAVTNAFLTKLRERKSSSSKALPGVSCIALVFSSGAPTDKLAQLILEAYARDGNLSDLRDKKAPIHPVFMHELACLLLETRAKPNNTGGLQRLDQCDFHQHPRGAACDVENRPRKHKRV